MATLRTRKRGNTYTYIFEAGKKSDGKRNTITRGGYSTKEEAYQAGITAFTQYKHRGSLTPDITFKVFAGIWSEHVRQQVRENTYNGYVAVSKQALRFFDDMPIKDITPKKCEDFIKHLATQGYAYKYIQYVKTVMRQILEYAIYPHQILDVNPIEKIRIPKNTRRDVIRRKIITLKEFSGLLQKYPYGSRYHMFMQIAFRTGMRVSEILGLTWENVDLQKCSIQVRQQLLSVHGHGLMLVPELKTSSSSRDIPIDKKFAELLLNWKQDQELNSIIQGDRYLTYYTNKKGSLVRTSLKLLPPGAKRINFICTDELGTHISRCELMSALRKDGLNSHSFRHTHATMLLESGAPLKGISDRLGHAGCMITSAVYVHNTEKMQLDTAAAFVKLMSDI